MNDKTQRYTMVRPLVSIMITPEVHDAIKVYAFSKQMRLREATEHLVKLALYREYHKEDKEE